MKRPPLDFIAGSFNGVGAVLMANGFRRDGVETVVIGVLIFVIGQLISLAVHLAFRERP